MRTRQAVDRHTGEQRFAAEYVTYGRLGKHGYAPGWYVVAHCSCHDGVIVSGRLENEAATKRAVAALMNR